MMRSLLKRAALTALLAAAATSAFAAPRNRTGPAVRPMVSTTRVWPSQWPIEWPVIDGNSWSLPG